MLKVTRMSEITDRIKAYWNEVSDSEWYRSLRSEEAIARLKAGPESAFHPEVYALIRKYLPDLKGKRILVPSSGDNHAAFAFALLGARVTSSDISERQIENAAEVAERLELDIEFVCDDTMKLSNIPNRAYDLGNGIPIGPERSRGTGSFFHYHVFDRYFMGKYDHFHVWFGLPQP